MGGKERAGWAIRRNLQVPVLWIKDHRKAYPLRLLIFAYIKAIKHWYCPFYEPYYAMVVRLGGESTMEYAVVLIMTVDFEIYIAGHYKENDLAGWGFHAKHYRRSLRSAHPAMKEVFDDTAPQFPRPSGDSVAGLAVRS